MHFWHISFTIYAFLTHLLYNICIFFTHFLYNICISYTLNFYQKTIAKMWETDPGFGQSYNGVATFFISDIAWFYQSQEWEKNCR